MPIWLPRTLAACSRTYGEVRGNTRTIWSRNVVEFRRYTDHMAYNPTRVSRSYAADTWVARRSVEYATGTRVAQRSVEYATGTWVAQWSVEYAAGTRVAQRSVEYAAGTRVAQRSVEYAAGTRVARQSVESHNLCITAAICCCKDYQCTLWNFYKVLN